MIPPFKRSFNSRLGVEGPPIVVSYVNSGAVGSAPSFLRIESVVLDSGSGYDIFPHLSSEERARLCDEAYKDLMEFVDMVAVYEVTNP